MSSRGNLSHFGTPAVPEDSLGRKKGEDRGGLTVRTTSRSNSEDVDHLLIRSPIEEDAPLADSEAPEALGSAEALDIAIGKLADRRGDALAILPAQLAEGLQGSGADLDPPPAWISQRSAPPRRLTKRCQVRS